MSLTIPNVQYTGLSTDSKPSTDIFEGATYNEVDTHQLYYWTGTKWKTWEQLYKEGRWSAALAPAVGSAYGILSGGTILQSNDTFVKEYDTNHGLHQRVATGSTINTFGGMRCLGYCQRDLDPYLRVTFSLVHTTDITMFIGFTGYTSGTGRDLGDPNSTDVDLYPVNSAAGLKIENGGTEFKIYTNDGTGPGNTETTTVTTIDTDVHTFEIRALNSVPKFQYKFDNGSTWVDLINDFPLETNDMGFQIWLQNVNVAQDRRWRLIDVYTRILNRT